MYQILLNKLCNVVFKRLFVKKIPIELFYSYTP